MEDNQPSTTAQRVALRRAAHQLLDDPKIFDDPIALRIIGRESASVLLAEPSHFEETPLAPYLRASMAARSRFTEDGLAEAVQRGVTQYVILGAGLDTFAYRNPFPEDALQVFEVDHPRTQAWKRTRLEEGDIPLPRNLTFAPVDFETGTLSEGLKAAGFDPGRGTFFSWLGVTPYLTVEAVMATLSFVSTTVPGSGIVFDYMVPPSMLTPKQVKYFDLLAQRVASVGEPWRTFFEPAALADDLRAIGFSTVTDNGPDQINARYCADRADGLRVGSLSHLVYAQV